MSDTPRARFDAWMAALEERHLERLRFAEVSRALRALSSAYVERRDRLAHGAALDGGGKRAAFALFYGPLHYLLVTEVVARLPPAAGPIDTVVDLGCGTGAAGAAWAITLAARPGANPAEAGSHVGREAGSHVGREAGSRVGREAGSHVGREAGSRVGREAGSRVGREAGSRVGREAGSRVGREAGSRVAGSPRHRVPQVLGIDRHQWAVAEAAWTYRVFGLRGRTVQDDGARAPIPVRRAGLLAAYFVNELNDDGRARLLRRLLDAARRGATVLVVEPIARRSAPWWDGWAETFAEAGGRADEWRLPADLPNLVRRLDRAAGLSHEELTARTLFLGPGPADAGPWA
jgi:hypothetical protein